MPGKKTKRKALSIRRAEMKDLPAVVELWKKFIDHHHQICSRMTRGGLYHTHRDSRKDFAQYFLNATGDPKWLVMVAVCDGRVVGYTIASIVKRPPVLAEKSFGFISDIMVDKDYRRMGVADGLVEKTLAWFRQKRIKTVELNVLVGNRTGEAFWKDAGFETVLHRKLLKI